MPSRFSRPLQRLFLLACATLLVLSLMPTERLMPGSGSDKLDHLGAFLLLAVLGRLAWPGAGGGLALGLVAFGALIEGLQALTPHRYAEFGDLVADALGVGLGMALMIRVARGRRAAPEASVTTRRR